MWYVGVKMGGPWLGGARWNVRTHTHNKIRLLRGVGCLKKLVGGSVTACFAETKEWNRIGWSKDGFPIGEDTRRHLQ